MVFKYYSTFTLITFFLILGCKTPGIIIEESNYSVKRHRIAIAAALGPVQNVSENGRVVYSYYHDRELKNFEMTPDIKERLYTKVAILGSRRPYRVSVEVRIEQKDSTTKKFIDVGLDEDLAQKRADVITGLLNQGRADGSLFDEELPF